MSHMTNDTGTRLRGGFAPIGIILALAGILIVAAGIVFFVIAVQKAKVEMAEGVESFQRFVMPGSVTLELPAGQQAICHESAGLNVPKSPLEQVRLDPLNVSMNILVTDANGEPIEVRLAGLPEDKAELEAVIENPRGTHMTNRGLIVYQGIGEGDYYGSAVWLFDAQTAGEYTIEMDYQPGVRLDANLNMSAVEYRMANLREIEVGFAVGQDPLGLSFFKIMGLKGVAAISAILLCIGSAMAFLGLLWQKPQPPE